MKRPVRTTLIMAFLGGFGIYPLLTLLLTPFLGWPLTSRIILWALVTVYAVFLARWSETRLLSLLFPLALLLGAALWPGLYSGYFLILLGVFSWVRSGICFDQRPLRTVIAELVTVVGGISVIGLWLPGSAVQWGLAIWMFGLFQCLYFFITGAAGEDRAARKTLDPFESARQALERALDRPWAC